MSDIEDVELRQRLSKLATLKSEIRHLRQRCADCGGTGRVPSWNVNGGNYLVQCECRKVHRA
jgi:hypothetical protein